MNIKSISIFGLLIVCFITISCTIKLEDIFLDKNIDNIDLYKNQNSKKPVSIHMYENLEKYSDEYEIPKHIAYNIAYLETSYRGPFDWDYNFDRTSVVGALGPMQIMPNTANDVYKTKISTNQLKMDVEFNIKTSMILLSQLYKRYGDWGLVCGYYNTGRPMINDYAKFCISNRDYYKNWKLSQM